MELYFGYLLFALAVNVSNSFDPLPLYSPPLPTYTEATGIGEPVSGN